MEILFGAIFVLGLVTLVGHLIWKFLAWLVWLAAGTEQSQAQATPPRAHGADPYLITRGYIARLLEGGFIDAPTHRKVAEALAAYQREPVARSGEEMAGNAPPAEQAPVTVGPPPLPVIPLEATSPTAPTARRPALPADMGVRKVFVPPLRSTSRPAGVSSFMEESNIRWGELVGGLLIVGCSIALVVSFWAEISQRPVFKFSIFTAVTGALFGVGLYSEHRWKLPTTSRGILLIATLLVPLNCLAFAAFTPAGSPAALAIVLETTALLLFARLQWSAAKVIGPQWPALLTIGNILLSMLILVLHAITPPLPRAMQLRQLAAMPVGTYLLCSGLMLRRSRRWQTVRPAAADGVFSLLGILSFATALGLSLLVSQVSLPSFAPGRQDIKDILRIVSTLISIGGLPALAAGMFVWQRTTAPRWGRTRTVGASIGVLGAGILLAGIGLAWPQPAGVIPVAMVDFAALIGVAIVYDLPAACILAIPCLWIAWIVSFHVIAKHVAFYAAGPEIGPVLLRPSSGTALALLTLLSATVARGLLPSKPAHGHMIGKLTVIGAAASILLLNSNGFAARNDPHGAAWVYLAYSLVMFTAAWRSARASDAAVAWFLLGAAFAQFCVARAIGREPWATTLLAFSAMAAIVYVIAKRLGLKASNLLARPAYVLSLCFSIMGAAWLLGSATSGLRADAPAALFWLAGIWMVVAAGGRHVRIAIAAVCFATSGAYFLSIPAARPSLEFVDATRLLELNAAVLALLAIGAIGTWRALGSEIDPAAQPRFIRQQIVLAASFAGFVLAPYAATLVAFPGFAWPGFASEMPWLWMGTLPVVAAIVLQRASHPGPLTVRTLAMSATTFWVLVAGAIEVRAGGWNGFYFLMIAVAITAWFALAYGAWLARRLVGWSSAPHISAATAEGNVLNYHQPAQTVADRAAMRQTLLLRGRPLVPSVIRWSFGLAIAGVALALRAAVNDPLTPWPSVVIVLAISTLMIAIAWWAPRAWPLAAASVLFNLATTLVFIEKGWQLAGHWLLNSLAVNAAALALPGVAWLAIELQRLRPAGVSYRIGLPHRFAAVGSTLVLGLVAMLAFVVGSEAHADGTLTCFATIAVATVCAAGLWDALASRVLANLYAVGLIAVVLLLGFARRDAEGISQAAALGMSGFTIMVGAVFALRRPLAALLGRAGAEAEKREWRTGWITPANAVVAAVVTALAFWSDFAFAARGSRITPAVAAVVAGLSLILMTIGTSEIGSRQSALSIFAAAMVALAWAWSSPAQQVALGYSVQAFLTLAAIAALYSFVLPRVVLRGQAWEVAARSLALQVAAAAEASILTVLVLEIVSYINSGSVVIGRIEIALVLVALLFACAMLLFAAIRDAALSERARGALVYAAEATLALAFVHVRLTMPFLFGGFFAAYWPLVVMGLAFVGVGLGEVLERRRQSVLGRPLEQTGLFLPLLPVLAFWILPPRGMDYGQLLLTVAVFYALVAGLRKSWVYGILAALAANGALWHLLAHTRGWGFLEHPQVWLIPIALAMLGAAQLNRDRLNPEQLRLLRYGCLMLIYASSTADIFLNGVARAPWLPLVLAVLSVAGVLAGILLRVRPFLFLGSGFLLIAVFTMIYYASSQLHWTWIWYVAGIVLGVGIIVLFALFEKKRAEITSLVRGLRQWQ